MEDETLFTIRSLILVILILMNGCTQKQEIIEVGTPVMVETKDNIETKVIENDLLFGLKSQVSYVGRKA